MNYQCECNALLTDGNKANDVILCRKHINSQTFIDEIYRNVEFRTQNIVQIETLNVNIDDRINEIIQENRNVLLKNTSTFLPRSYSKPEMKKLVVNLACRVAQLESEIRNK